MYTRKHDLIVMFYQCAQFVAAYPDYLFMTTIMFTILLKLQKFDNVAAYVIVICEFLYHLYYAIVRYGNKYTFSMYMHSKNIHSNERVTMTSQTNLNLC